MLWWLVVGGWYSTSGTPCSGGWWLVAGLTQAPTRYDSQLQQIDGTLSTIEMQREALEGANTNTAVLTTMNDAAKALKKANNELDVDKVGV